MQPGKTTFLQSLLILLITTVLVYGLMFTSRIIMARFLEVAVYGQIMYIWNISIVIGTILLLGRGQEATMTLPKLSQNKSRERILEYLQYGLIIAGIMILGFIVMFITRSSYIEYFLLSILYMLFYLNIFIFIGRKRYKLILVTNLIFYTLFVIFLLISAFLWELNYSLVMNSFFISFSISIVIGWIYIFFANKVNIKSLLTIKLKNLFSTQFLDSTKWKLFICDLVSISYNLLFFTVVKIIKPNDEYIAYYSIAFTIGQIALLIVQRIAQVTGPKIISIDEFENIEGAKENSAKEQKYKQDYWEGFRINLALTSISILILGIFGEIIIQILFGSSYAISSFYFVSIYLIFIFFKSNSFFNLIILRNTDRLNKFVIINIISFLIFSSFSIILLNFSGYLGMIFAFLIYSIVEYILTIIWLNTEKLKIINLKKVVTSFSSFLLIFIVTFCIKFLVFSDNFIMRTRFIEDLYIFLPSILVMIILILTFGLIRKEDLRKLLMLIKGEYKTPSIEKGT